MYALNRAYSLHNTYFFSRKDEFYLKFSCFNYEKMGGFQYLMLFLTNLNLFANHIYLLFYFKLLS